MEEVMGFFKSLFGESKSENFDTISFIKQVNGYFCNQDYIDINKMNKQGAQQAFELDPNLPRIMQRSPLTMVGEFKYLLSEYEYRDEHDAMKKVVHAVLVFVNKYRNQLPSYINMTLQSSIPTLLMVEVSKECGLSMYKE